MFELALSLLVKLPSTRGIGDQPPAGLLVAYLARATVPSWAGALYYRFGSFSVLSCSWSRRHRRRDPAVGISVRPSAWGLTAPAGWLVTAAHPPAER